MPLYRGSRRLVLRRRITSVATNPPTVSFVGNFASSGSGSTTITGTVDIGNPAYILTRRVIVMLTGGSSATIPSSGTINSQVIDQMTALSLSATGLNCVEFVSAPVSSGTTSVAFSLTYNATMFANPRLSVYTVDNSLLSSPTPITGFTENLSGTGTDTTTVNTTTKAGGFILAGAWVGGGAGPSITASTETYGSADYSNSSDLTAHANGISSNAANSVSTQGPPAGGNSALGLAAYR